MSAFPRRIIKALAIIGHHWGTTRRAPGDSKQRPLADPATVAAYREFGSFYGSTAGKANKGVPPSKAKLAQLAAARKQPRHSARLTTRLSALHSRPLPQGAIFAIKNRGSRHRSWHTALLEVPHGGAPGAREQFRVVSDSIQHRYRVHRPTPTAITSTARPPERRGGCRLPVHPSAESGEGKADLPLRPHPQYLLFLFEPYLTNPSPLSRVRGPPQRVTKKQETLLAGRRLSNRSGFDPS